MCICVGFSKNPPFTFNSVVVLFRSAAAKTDAKAKAAKAAKSLKKTNRKKVLKVRTSVTFHRPKTLKKARDPKYPRISAPPMQKLDHFQVTTALPDYRVTFV